MSETAMIVQGIVKADGTLELAEKLTIPPGAVQVTIMPLAQKPQPERFWKMMESIWSDLRTSGRPPRTREMIDAEINSLRDEAEEEMQAIEQLHARSKREPGQ